MAEVLDAFWRLVADLGACMVTTRQANALRARPMAADVDAAAREFRFLTRLSSHNTDELAASPDVNLAFSDPSRDSYVSVSGQAYVTQDRHLIDELWGPEAERYLGLAPDDADVAVIRVVPAEAEQWDGNGRLTATWSLFKPRLPASDSSSAQRGEGDRSP